MAILGGGGDRPWEHHPVISSEQYSNSLYSKIQVSKLIFLRSISANEIVCSWSNSTADMSGVVLVTVNNAMVQNNSVTYQYLSNPVYSKLTPQQTIRS